MRYEDAPVATVVVHATPGAEELVAASLRKAGLAADMGEPALKKSLEGPHSVFLDVESWFQHLWPLLAPAAWPVAQKVWDGAVGEVGAEALRAVHDRMRQLARAARGIIERSGARGASVKVRVTDARGTARLYYLPVADLDEATAAIVADLGIEVVGRGNGDRDWVETERRWVGTRDRLSAADPAFAEKPNAPEEI
ncbi:MAG: hypothetical protein JO083_05405 [Candidatus Eremiobacteraeota bacterium]|nr:hypothetical protein [Candidatus Eremiobacteraeota bacterium]